MVYAFHGSTFLQSGVYINAGVIHCMAASNLFLKFSMSDLWLFQIDNNVTANSIPESLFLCLEEGPQEQGYQR